MYLRSAYTMVRMQPDPLSVTLKAGAFLGSIVALTWLWLPGPIAYAITVISAYLLLAGAREILRKRKNGKGQHCSQRDSVR